MSNFQFLMYFYSVEKLICSLNGLFRALFRLVIAAAKNIDHF